MTSKGKERVVTSFPCLFTLSARFAMAESEWLKRQASHERTLSNGNGNEHREERRNVLQASKPCYMPRAHQTPVLHVIHPIQAEQRPSRQHPPSMLCWARLTWTRLNSTPFGFPWPLRRLHPTRAVLFRQKTACPRHGRSGTASSHSRARGHTAVWVGWRTPRRRGEWRSDLFLMPPRFGCFRTDALENTSICTRSPSALYFLHFR